MDCLQGIVNNLLVWQSSCKSKLRPLNSESIDTFQNHAPFLAAILNGAYVEMLHNCCVPMCHGKGYRTVNIDGKEVKITFHKFPDANRKIMRLKWLHAIL